MTATRSVRFRHLLLAATLLSSPLMLRVPTPAAAQVSVGISVALAPPALPDYEQPPMPDLGYVWTPGYWAWAAPAGYYWIPGTWVMPPAVNVLWTPPYWSWLNGRYHLHAGYWGAHVGYYGGVNYGYGYSGQGYDGGRWEGRNFSYNRAVNNFGSVVVHNAYDRQVPVRNRDRGSFAGGPGGNRSAATAADRQTERERHVSMTAEQTSHFSAAGRMPELAVSHNNGRPPVAATPRAAQFQGTGVTHAGPAADAHPNRPDGHAGAPQPEHTAPLGAVGRPPEPAMARRPPVGEASRPVDRLIEPQRQRDTSPPLQREATQPPRHEAVAPHAAPSEREKER